MGFGFRLGLQGTWICTIAILVSACSAKVEVPQISINPTAERLPGNYAAFVQSGGWDLSATKSTWNCSAWTFDTDVNGPYDAAMRSLMTQSLERVSFVETPLRPEQVTANGYDAFIVVHQGNADATFGVVQKGFLPTATSSVSLNTIVAIINGTGNAYQASPMGMGSGSADIILCDGAVEAVKKAAKTALESIVRQTDREIRSGLEAAKARR